MKYLIYIITICYLIACGSNESEIKQVQQQQIKQIKTVLKSHVIYISPLTSNRYTYIAIDTINNIITHVAIDRYGNVTVSNPMTK